MGALLKRYSTAHQKIIKAGFTGGQIQDAVLDELDSRIGLIPWAELSKAKRKTEWLQLCLVVVRRLDRLLVELKAQRRAQESDLHPSKTDEPRLNQTSAPAESKVVSPLDKLKEKRENGKNRTRRLAMRERWYRDSLSTGQKIDNNLRTTEAKGQNRKNKARRLRSSSKAASAAPASKRASGPRLRPGDQTRLAKSLTATSKILRKVAVNSTSLGPLSRNTRQSTLRIRRLEVSEIAEQNRLARITERTQEHTARQKLRSQWRARLLCAKMARNRQSLEKNSIGDDLWQHAQEEQHSTPGKDDLWAWPRLAQKQSELLADEVQAFVRGRT